MVKKLMSLKRGLVLGLTSISALLGISGCASGGDSGRAANPYLQIVRPELVVPPEYKLRPPEAGLAQPAEIQAQAGVSRTFGVNVGVGASAIEQALVESAGAVAVSPVIRSQIDYEGAAVIRKPEAVSDNIRGFKNDSDAQTKATEDVATGGGIVTIGSVSKLPGT